MKEKKKALNEFIALLPMPAAIIDFKGVIEDANLVFKEKFNFDRISKRNKIKLQTFLNFDISNLIQRLSVNDMSISTYDYKFIDLDENEVMVDLHFKSITHNKILMTLDQKNNYKSYFTQASKIFSDKFMGGFINSLSRNISSPVTNLLGALHLIKEKKTVNEFDKLLNIISEEGEKIKKYITKVNSFNTDISIYNEYSNIHKCLNESLKMIDSRLISKVNFYKHFDPSIPDIIFNDKLLTKCFYNILINAFENKKCTEITITTKINHSIFIKSEELQKVLKLPIHVKITDNGQSINEDIERFMFYPFITSKLNAEGLGLTFVNLILSQYGGHFKYEREKVFHRLTIFFQ